MARARTVAVEDVYEPDPEAVVRRLHELGIDLEDLLESSRIGHLKSDFTTKAHPVTYPGTVVWGEITAEIRTRLGGRGWLLDDTDNIPKVISPEGVTVIAVRGNDQTGARNQHSELNTRRARGEASVRIIKMNTQLVLQLEDSDSSGDHLVTQTGTWFYLYNRTNDTVRSELSFAKAVSSSGKLLQWGERLILPDIDMSSTPPVRRVLETEPEVDVRVSRRAG